MVDHIGRYSKQVHLYRSITRLKRALEHLTPLASTGEASPLPQIKRLELRLDEVERIQLVDDYKRGATSSELRVKYGIGKGSVLKLLHEAGVSMRRRPMPAESVARAAKLYEQGLTLRQIGEQLGLGKTTVREALVRAGVVMRGAYRKKSN